MKIKSFQGGFDKNLCYLIWCEKTKMAGLIDLSVEIQPIIEFIESENLILSKILITHTHHDHIAYLHDINNIYNNINIHCHHKAVNAKFEFNGLSHNQIIAIGDEILIAIYTPGHFIDSMCFWNQKRKCLFTGDTMFVGRTGRTISKYSNIKDLYISTYKKILTLPNDTMVYPGHHYGFKKSISIKENIEISNFFNCKSLNEFEKIMQNFEKNR
tara:strand:+ start:716 stop:1357 length:642 start_codon:yes stop_codon:yes gene_type:complete